MQGGGQQHIVQSPAGASGIDIGETSVVHEESVDGGNWQEVVFVNRSPGSRVFPSAVAHNDFLYIFGGHDGSIYRNDLLLFNLATRSWQFDLDISGDGPSPRDAHAAVIHGECMYVFGGYDSKRYLNDFHRFHFNTCTWSSVAFGGGAPSPRGGHTAVVHGQQTLVFGGCDGWNYFNDLFKFGFDTEQWLPVRVTGTAPGARSAPATVIHESQATMYIFGGYDGGRSLNDLFRFNLSTSEWAQVSASSPAAQSAAAVPTRSPHLLLHDTCAACTIERWGRRLGPPRRCASLVCLRAPEEATRPSCTATPCTHLEASRGARRSTTCTPSRLRSA